MWEKWVIIGLWLVAVLSFGIASAGGRIPGATWLAAVLTVAVVMAAYLGLADSQWVALMKRKLKGRWLLSSLPLLILFALFSGYAGVTGQLSGMAAVTILFYLFGPWVLIQVDSGEARLTPALTLAILILWLPVESGWLPRAALPPGGPVQLPGLLSVVLSLYLFLVVRGLPNMGYSFRLNAADWRKAAVYFSLFSAFFAIPLAIVLNFAASTPEMRSVTEWPVQALAIFFLVAVPEEILFRGIIQNLLHKSLPGRFWTPLFLASVIFGLAHINNREPPLWSFGNFEIPWAYLILATIAGIFYGLTYIKTKKLTAAAVVHGLVDTWWVLFFAG